MQAISICLWTNQIIKICSRGFIIKIKSGISSLICLSFLLLLPLNNVNEWGHRDAEGVRLCSVLIIVLS